MIKCAIVIIGALFIAGWRLPLPEYYRRPACTQIGKDGCA